MNKSFYWKNFFYSLVFYMILLTIINYKTELTSAELLFCMAFMIFSSFLFPFSLFFLENKFRAITGTFNWVNWGFSICLLLSVPPVGFLFLLYYVVKSRSI